MSESQVLIDIYADSACGKLLEQATLGYAGQCYRPIDSKGNAMTFRCFSIRQVGAVEVRSASLTAFKDESCFAQFDSDEMIFHDLNEIENIDQKPFKMKALSLETTSP